MKNIRRPIVTILTIALIFGSTFVPAKDTKSSNAYGAESKTYRILEIQPDNYGSPVYFQKKFAKDYSSWKAFINSGLAKEGKVEVTQMSISEFNGRSENLTSSYDLIYIGYKDAEDDAGFFIRDYADYHHMGKSMEFGGMSTYTSGNDITNKKKEELESFVEAKNVLLLSSYMYDKSGKLMIDAQSNMYSLISSMGISYSSSSSAEGGIGTGNKDNAILCKLESMSSESTMFKQIGKYLIPKEEKCQIKFSNKAGSFPPSNSYLNDKDIKDTELKYVFSIEDKTKIGGNSTYTVDLHIDQNSDGKYSQSEKAEKYMKLTDGSGKKVGFDTLKSGTEYTLTADMADYVGIVYWRLKVTKESNKSITCEIRDYCKIKPQMKTNSDGTLVPNKKELKVMQIMSGEGDGSGDLRLNSVWLPTSEEMKYLESTYDNDEYIRRYAFNGYITNDTKADALATKITRAEAAKTKNGQFLIMSGTAKGSKIQEKYLIVTIKFWLYTRNLDEFVLNIERVPVETFERAKYKESSNYDMLILGFGDQFTGFLTDDSDPALKAIEAFIQDGRAVLFAHDVTSSVTKAGGTFLWGYKLNLYFRDMAGMDRYGSMGGKYMEHTDYDPKNWEKDYVYDGGSYSNKASAMGFTDALISNSNNKLTTTVASTNDGQINTYPYDLSGKKTIKVANTHNQWYQLDLESDDMNVWYALTKTPGEGAAQYYENRKNVRNDYYIYNKGNVTYTGAGHTGTLTNDEIKLFVNTMISSYRAANDGVSMNILNPDASKDNKGNLYFPVSYMKDKPKLPIGSSLYDGKGTPLKPAQFNKGAKPYKRVKFSLTQNSVAVIKKMDVTFAVEDGGITKAPISNIYTTDGKLVDKNIGLIPDVEYYADIPISYVGGNERMKTTASVKLTYSNMGTGSTNTKVIEKKIDFLRKVLFNLN